MTEERPDSPLPRPASGFSSLSVRLCWRRRGEPCRAGALGLASGERPGVRPSRTPGFPARDRLPTRVGCCCERNISNTTEVRSSASRRLALASGSMQRRGRMETPTPKERATSCGLREIHHRAFFKADRCSPPLHPCTPGGWRTSKPGTPTRCVVLDQSPAKRASASSAGEGFRVWQQPRASWTEPSGASIRTYKVQVSPQTRMGLPGLAASDKVAATVPSADRR